MNEEDERGRDEERREERREEGERQSEREREKEGKGDEDAPRMPQEIISPPGCAASGNT